MASPRDMLPARHARAPGRVAVWAVLAICVLGSLGGCAASGSSYRFADESGRPAFGLPRFWLGAYRSVQDRPGQDPDLAVVAAISGGGHRSANFALGVLLELETMGITTAAGQTDALREVDYFSTVSGGAFAAGAYLSSLRDYLDQGGFPGAYRLARAVGTTIQPGDEPWLLRGMRTGYEQVLLESTFALTPFRMLDRGDFIEEQIDRLVLGARYRQRAGGPSPRATTRSAPGAAYSFQLGDVFVPAASDRVPRLPYWFVHATVYRNGAPLTFAPSELLDYGIVEYTHNRSKVSLRTGRGVVPGTSRVQFVMDMPYSVAIKASSAFPGAIPATTLRSERDEQYPFVHALDGGVVDNLGIINSMRVLGQEHTPRRVLILIDAYNRDPAPYSKGEAAPPALVVGAAAGVMPFDSRHGLLDEQIERFANSLEPGVELTVVHLSFDDLTEDDVPSRSSVRSIPATFNVSKSTQEALIHAGRLVVRKRADEIRAALQSATPRGQAVSATPSTGTSRPGHAPRTRR